MIDSAGDQVHSCSLALRSTIPRLRSKSKANSQKSAHNALAKVNVKLESKHLSLATAALLAAGGLWLARPAWRTHAIQKSSLGIGFKTPHGPPRPGQMLRPPAPSRRFTDFTPEQRVEFARVPYNMGPTAEKIVLAGMPATLAARLLVGK